MTEPRYHLAQANIARMVAPIDDPVMAGFVEQLEYINSVADRSPGFVWRLQTPDGDATAMRIFDDDRILFNMSVWTGIEPLYDYTYRSDHLGPLRNRKQWFDRIDGAHLVLWWVPAGHIPTVEEAKDRFERLNRDGPGPDAFTFTSAFSPDGSALDRGGRPDWAAGAN
jgi:hypothetical protein